MNVNQNMALTVTNEENSAVINTPDAPNKAAPALKFAHLHLHSQYSLLDGANKIDDIINKSIEFNMLSVAITDHGNLFGALEFYEKAVKKGVKPIIGCEVYVAPGSRFAKNQNEKHSYHLILLAMNEDGYKNLCKLVSKAYLEGFYYKPRIDKEILQEYNKGLFALSACLKGEIPQKILSGNVEETVKSVQFFSKVFNNDRFYLEVQENGIKEQNIVNKVLLELGQKYSIPVVATNDCHYLLKEDYEAHDILLCIQTGKKVDDKDRMRFTTKDLYFKSAHEMHDAFSAYPESVLTNSADLSDKINFNFKLGEFHFPAYKPKKTAADSINTSISAVNNNNTDGNSSFKNAESMEELFERDAREGFEERINSKEAYKPRIEEYRQRFEREIDVIKKSKFAGYFLIVSDFIKYSKEHDIPVGPGRGSAAGSLIAYCLKITDIDPIKYDLLFERFLNPERISMPDIDSDFCINGRDEVIKYVAAKYGESNVSQIITFGTMLAKGVIRDTGRALNMPYSEVDKIAKLIPNTLKITLDEAIKEEPKLRELIRNDDKVKKLIEIAKKLEGLTRHASTHAAGVVIANKPLDEYLPLYKGSKDGDVVTTQYTMEGVEKIGLIKFDFLGLKTLTVMKEAKNLINEANKNNGIEEEFDIYNIDLADLKTSKLLSSGDTTGVFQLESSGMKELLLKLAPKSLEDIIPLVALYRPGPLGSGMVDDFIKAKNGVKKIKYLHPLLEDILKETYGVILYQEQIMKIAIKLANFSMGDADVLRKGVGKKNAELIEKMRNKFIEGCKSNNIENTISEKIFSLITKFGEYGFNKSHSAAYALVAYMTAYLKANYTDYFIAALLSSEMSNTDKLAKIINESNQSIIIAPSVNYSTKHFTVLTLKNHPDIKENLIKNTSKYAADIVSAAADLDEKNVIQIGLGAIKNVGDAAIESILAERENGKYKDLLDFCSRVDTRKVNKRTIENLIKSGALDINGYETRGNMLKKLEQVMQEAASIRQKKSSDEFELPLLFNMEPTDVHFSSQSSASESEFNNGSGKWFSEDTLSAEDAAAIQCDKKEILAYEKEAIGFYISGHPLDGYEEKISLITDYSISSFIKECVLNASADDAQNNNGSGLEREGVKNLNYKQKYNRNDKKKYVLCGIVNQLKIHNTRNNEKMASFVLSDADVSVDVVFFPKNYMKYENIFKTSEPVVISGRVDESSDQIGTAALKKDSSVQKNNNSYDDSENSENEYKESKNFTEDSDFDARDYNIKIIGETIDFLDSYIVKNNSLKNMQDNNSLKNMQDNNSLKNMQNNNSLKNMQNNNGINNNKKNHNNNIALNKLCVIEISPQNIYDRNKEEFRNFINRLKIGFINCSGTSKVLIKAKNIEIKLNDDILVDVEALKKTDIAQSKSIRII
jgi:DNA polymerase-3 subunit alpha